MDRSNLRRGIAGLALATLFACSGSGTHQKVLKVAVDGYHDNLRWKRLTNASTYRVPEERSEFLARYLAVEDDLSIDAIEVRGVTFIPDSEPPAADVVVTAEAYLLPSNVLHKHVITERWELRGDEWLLVDASLELAPEVRSPHD